MTSRKMVQNVIIKEMGNVMDFNIVVALAVWDCHDNII